MHWFFIMNINLPHIFWIEINMYLPKCEYNMVLVVDSCLLTQANRYSTCCPGHSHSSHSVLLFLLSLLRLFLLLPLFLLLLLFALHYYTYQFFFHQSHVLFSVGSTTTRIPFDAGWTSSGSVSICSQGYVMDCFIAIQCSFLSWNRYLQCKIGNRVWPVSVYYFHLQRLQEHYLVHSISLPHHWWIWKGFWRQ